MPLSNSVLRRYTPPTCTLEIAAKSSPLSRWAGKSITKDLHFELRFDDPRQPEEERVTIRGNAQDLEMLSDAVNNYIQNFLTSSSIQLPLIPPTETNGNSAPDQQANGKPTAQYLSIVNPSETSATSPHPFPTRIASELSLQPKGLLLHELFLGQLATLESGLSVDLSVLQLFDLATALDEYAAEMVALPKFNSPLPWKKAPPAWTSAAAMVVLAVGVTGGIAYFNQQNKPQTTALKTTQPTPGLTPLTPLPVPVAPVVISPFPTPVVPPALATSPNLAPPTRVIIPTTETASLPPGVTPPTTSVNTAPTTKATPFTVLPQPRPTIPRATSGISSLPAPAISQRNAASTAAGTTSPTQASIPKAPSAPPPLNLPSLANSSPSPGAVTTAQATPTADTLRGTGSASDVTPSASTSAPDAAKSKLSDVIPQVAEARSFLEQKWKPPANFSQTLEYSLELSPDGTIKRIIPLGEAARQNIDSTGIPKPGDRFVSPVLNGSNPTIRAVFKPDGTVSTFLP